MIHLVYFVFQGIQNDGHPLGLGDSNVLTGAIGTADVKFGEDAEQELVEEERSSNANTIIGDIIDLVIQTP
jgi:hypothetical protein